jgi:hypothetical protein
MPGRAKVTLLYKSALAVRARYVSTSLLAEGNEGTRRKCCVPSSRVRDAHRVAHSAYLSMNRFRGKVV